MTGRVLIRVLGVAGIAAAVAAAAVVTAACKRRERPLFERVYGLDEVPRFQIELTPEARAQLAAAPREWVRARFAHGDRSYAAVGVRLKGHRSLRKLDDKPSFKVQLDRFGKHELAGQRVLTLNNMVEDPAMMREVLAYRLYRALGVAAPAAGFAEVTVDGALAGLYAVIESPDKRFLEKRFADASGPIYEGEWGCDLIPEDVAGFDRDGGPRDRAALAELARVAAGDAATLFGPSSPLDVPAFLRFLAVEMFVGNFDGYRHGHNYRIYFEPTRRRWYFMPWGLDRTFVRNMSIYDSNGYLARRCFADAACRLAYARAMRDVVAEARRLELDASLDLVARVTEPGVARDPHRGAASIKSARAELREFLLIRPSEVDRELTCLDADGNERDVDGDGFGCLDCDDADPAIHPGAAEACDGVDTNCDRRLDDAPCACSALTVGAATFALCDVAMPHAEAVAFCAARGEVLARLDDDAQADAVAAAARALYHTKWWIGLDDRAEEGVFRWLTGDAALGYTRWDRGEPDNAGCNQDCVAIDDDDANWGDTHCLEPHPFVCRAP